jgi:hypothetical protein
MPYLRPAEAAGLILLGLGAVLAIIGLVLIWWALA